MLNMQVIDDISVDDAFKRLVTFNTLNRNRDYEDKVDGLLLYCQSVGIDELLIEKLFNLCEFNFKSDKLEPPSCAFIGFLLGLAASQSMADREQE